MRKFNGPVMGSLMGNGTGGNFEINAVLMQVLMT